MSTKHEAARAVQAAMRERGLTFAELAEQLGRPKVWVAAAVSAINFRADIERVADPAGDRVRITLDGKFLPYQFADEP